MAFQTAVLVIGGPLAFFAYLVYKDRGFRATLKAWVLDLSIEVRDKPNRR